MVRYVWPYLKGPKGFWCKFLTEDDDFWVLVHGLSFDSFDNSFFGYTDVVQPLAGHLQTAQKQKHCKHWPLEAPIKLCLFWFGYKGFLVLVGFLHLKTFLNPAKTLHLNQKNNVL